MQNIRIINAPTHGLTIENPGTATLKNLRVDGFGEAGEAVVGEPPEGIRFMSFGGKPGKMTIEGFDVSGGALSSYIPFRVTASDAIGSIGASQIVDHGGHRFVADVPMSTGGSLDLAAFWRPRRAVFCGRINTLNPTGSSSRNGGMRTIHRHFYTVPDNTEQMLIGVDLVLGQAVTVATNASVTIAVRRQEPDGTNEALASITLSSSQAAGTTLALTFGYDVLDKNKASAAVELNFYQALHQGYGELGVFGTDAMVYQEDYHTVMHLANLTVGEFAVATDWKGRVNTLVREFERPVAEVVAVGRVREVSEAFHEASVVAASGVVDAKAVAVIEPLAKTNFSPFAEFNW